MPISENRTKKTKKKGSASTVLSSLPHPSSSSLPHPSSSALSMAIISFIDAGVLFRHGDIPLALDQSRLCRINLSPICKRKEGQGD
jgi:hypothetical protein